MFFGLPDPDPLVRGMNLDPDPALDPDPGINSKKNLNSYYFVNLFYFLSLKNDVNLASKSNKQKKCVFAGILKVNDENSRIRIQDPDPLVRGMDPRIRIRIHPKMSWIRNTATNNCLGFGFL
jgi:hypothetical protein